MLDWNGIAELAPDALAVIIVAIGWAVKLAASGIALVIDSFTRRMAVNRILQCVLKMDASKNDGHGLRRDPRLGGTGPSARAASVRRSAAG